MQRTLLVLATGIGGALPAWGAPTFVADNPHDVEVATAAWHAGVACTGREGHSGDVVEIVERTIPGDYLGVADTGEDGVLRRIELNAPDHRRDEVLAHEVSHAWVNRGPTALVEGAAELLADCMVAHTPGLAPLQYDDGRELVALGDLRTWRPPDEVGPAALDGVRTDAYLGAARMMRTAALVVDPKELWATSCLEWDRFDALLVEAGEVGAPLLAAITGGVEAQRRALSDADLDGLTALSEAQLGTNPAAFDTDGNGWWDGAITAPAGATPLPMDGTPMCTGVSTPPDGAPVPAVTGGNLRGQRAPKGVFFTAADPRSATSSPDQVATTASVGSSPILARLSGASSNTSGGAWGTLMATDLPPSTGCVSDPKVTVWAHDDALGAHAEPLTKLVHQAIERAELRFGPGPGRIAIALGGPTSTFEDDVAWFSTADVQRALQGDNLDHLAYLAVSLRHSWASGDPDWAGAVALSRSLQGTTLGPPTADRR